jgi:hypothetical protein
MHEMQLTGQLQALPSNKKTGRHLLGDLRTGLDALKKKISLAPAWN